jgi:hypothetical protein
VLNGGKVLRHCGRLEEIKPDFHDDHSKNDLKTFDGFKTNIGRVKGKIMSLLNGLCGYIGLSA